MKTLAALLGVLALASAVATAAVAAAPRHSSVVIRHQMRHCHTWAAGTGAYAAHVDVTLATGGSITFTNNDVMSHRLIEKSGPAASYVGSRLLSHVGAKVKASFPRAGTYRFTTRAGEDYMKGVMTMGEDNVLTLTVTVR
jgi:plastocyanin